jgi:hypothetical protein
MKRAALVMAVLFAPVLTTGAESSSSDDGGLVIAPRPDPNKKPQKVWLAKSLSEGAYIAEAAEAAKLLANDKLDSETRAAISVGIKQDPERSGKAFVRCLDPQTYTLAAVRIGALRGIEIGNPSAPAIGKGLGGSAIAEPVPEVRSAALKLIRSRNDAGAAGEILRFWRGAFDSDLGFDEPRRAAAVAAMRDLGDKRIYRAMLAYVWLELRVGNASAARVDSVAITGPGPINLPIDMPSIDLMSTEGTIIVPAATSMKQISGQDFGKNMDKWREWLDKQPDFKE